MPTLPGKLKLPPPVLEPNVPAETLMALIVLARLPATVILPPSVSVFDTSVVVPMATAPSFRKMASGFCAAFKIFIA